MQEDIKKPQEQETPVVPIKEGEDGGKVFSQEELDKILSERLAREKKASEERLKAIEAESAKRIQETVQKALEEERKLSKMSSEEKERELLEKQAKENAQREELLTIRENTLIATDKLVEANIQPEKAKKIASFLVNKDLQVQEENIATFVALFSETVSATVQAKMSGNPPKDVQPNSNDSLKDFKPMSYI